MNNNYFSLITQMDELLNKIIMSSESQLIAITLIEMNKISVKDVSDIVIKRLNNNSNTYSQIILHKKLFDIILDFLSNDEYISLMLNNLLLSRKNTDIFYSYKDSEIVLSLINRGGKININNVFLLPFNIFTEYIILNEVTISIDMIIDILTYTYYYFDLDSDMIDWITKYCEDYLSQNDCETIVYKVKHLKSSNISKVIEVCLNKIDSIEKVNHLNMMMDFLKVLTVIDNIYNIRYGYIFLRGIHEFKNEMQFNVNMSLFILAFYHRKKETFEKNIVFNIQLKLVEDYISKYLHNDTHEYVHNNIFTKISFYSDLVESNAYELFWEGRMDNMIAEMAGLINQ